MCLLAIIYRTSDIHLGTDIFSNQFSFSLYMLNAVELYHLRKVDY